MGTDTRDRANVEMWDRRIEIEIMQNMTGAFRHGHPQWEGRISGCPISGLYVRASNGVARCELPAVTSRVTV